MKQKHYLEINKQAGNDGLAVVTVEKETKGMETEKKPIHGTGSNTAFELSDSAGIFLINSLNDMESFKDRIVKLIEDIEQDFPEFKNEREQYNLH